jgi:hypothetical protein
VSTTLKQARQNVGLELNEITLGTVTLVPSTTTFTTYDLVDSLETEDAYQGSWVRIVTGATANTERRISAFTQAAGVATVTLSRLWTSPDLGAEFEIHSALSSDVLNTLINRAIAGLTYEVDQAIDVVAGQVAYSLAAYTWLTDRKQVWDVEWRDYDATYGSRYLPINWFDVQLVDGVLTLLLQQTYGSTGDHLYLRCWRHYSELTLTDDTSSTDCPEEWLRAATICKVYEYQMEHAPTEDSKRIGEKLKRAEAKRLLLGLRHIPRPLVRVQHKDTGMYSGNYGGV